MTLPTPDPAEGAAAEAHAAQARRSALAAVSAGSVTLAELFDQVEAEEPKHQLGHIHLRAALLALPHIGEIRADRILDEAGLASDTHLAELGIHQRAGLIALAEAEA
jgi:hypothetical protein